MILTGLGEPRLFLRGLPNKLKSLKCDALIKRRQFEWEVKEMKHVTDRWDKNMKENSGP